MTHENRSFCSDPVVESRARCVRSYRTSRLPGKPSFVRIRTQACIPARPLVGVF
ncbi:hypothetical protein BD310DRAFT_935840 [Dichomitus squalens]|uniref:Uncharacterized protein n=1 Tax=Dichomitus squalens TaxID=114155 RepID=A0A4Q9PK50_9APHY|nr:hypothetical protein BD310DRAFT_935840 [Dichomitus squalens]